MNDAPIERRARQRILVQRPGWAPFVMKVEGAGLELVDLSLEGFAVRLTTPPPADGPFAFALGHEADPAPITGQAVAVNRLGGEAPEAGQAGCRFLAFDGDGENRLRAWLAGHVVAVSAMPVTVDEATAIVNGRSIV